VYAGIVVIAAIMAVCVYLGAAASGSDALTPMAGTIVLGLYAAALVGVGFAVGGWRTSVAAEIVALVVVATYLIDLLSPALSLPNWFHQIALTSHLGQPMVGQWDPVGVVACIVLAVGGLAVGGWGLRSRDISRFCSAVNPGLSQCAVGPPPDRHCTNQGVASIGGTRGSSRSPLCQEEEEGARNHEHRDSGDKDPVAPPEVAVHPADHDEDRGDHRQQGQEWMGHHTRRHLIPPPIAAAR
jgi:hypothetical protein